MPVPVYLALLHYPVVNRKGALVTTSVTNMDIHDISRTATTYGLEEYFLVTPVEDQRELVEEVLRYWRKAESQAHHPDRAQALAKVRAVRDFDEVKAAIHARHGQFPEVVLTDAQVRASLPKPLSYADYRRELEGRNPETGGQPVLIVFGTGWGISDVFYPEVHRILAPVYGPEGGHPESGMPLGYNHLSVRAAVAVILDRLFGK